MARQTMHAIDKPFLHKTCIRHRAKVTKPRRLKLQMTCGPNYELAAFPQRFFWSLSDLQLSVVASHANCPVLAGQAMQTIGQYIQSFSRGNPGSSAAASAPSAASLSTFFCIARYGMCVDPPPRCLDRSNLNNAAASPLVQHQRQLERSCRSSCMQRSPSIAESSFAALPLDRICRLHLPTAG